ncbi:hypothetical protein JK386_11375 [Nocardioides sp. zg-536]|uniref:DUF6318 domain-containing protein n=1 Tax=Nocardioides faecalis TaxID=2803858 RepID=A0A938Y754_9ACTN|nr:DUF6318 family protein [Nocardioides faecalis]MBM9460505.1 hypothetical protein [Nocardioides faecalis]QVI57560.1 hypothetical protein KG111_10695 [Nocardioides faecalis]
MRMLRAPGLALTAALLACALAGCSDADGKESSPRPSTSTSSPTVPASSTPARSTPAEPELPAAADRPTKNGARAFIEHYWDLINYAQESGDVTALRQASSHTCEGCSTGITGIEALYREGGYTVGGQYSIDSIKINRLVASKNDIDAFEALLSVTNAPQQIVNGDGDVQRLKSSTNEVVVATLWSEGEWQLQVMEIK